MYYIYMLRCEDNSIYTGIASDIERRMNEHFSKNNKCAKYTLRHTASNLEKVFYTENRALASKLEFHIKKNLTKTQKEELIKDAKKLRYLKEKINIKDYKVLSKKEINNINAKENV